MEEGLFRVEGWAVVLGFWEVYGSKLVTIEEMDVVGEFGVGGPTHLKERQHHRKCAAASSSFSHLPV